jgi:hypothetical protein
MQLDNKRQKWAPVIDALDKTLDELIQKNNQQALKCIYKELVETFPERAFLVNEKLVERFDFAVQTTSYQCFEYILELASNGIAQDRLFQACITIIIKDISSPKKLRFLQRLVDAGCDLNWRNAAVLYNFKLDVETEFNCALHAALYVKQVKIVKWLFEHGAILKIEDVEYALERDDFVVISTLIEIMCPVMARLYMILVNRFDRIELLEVLFKKISKTTPDQDCIVLLEEGVRVMINASLERNNTRRVVFVLEPGMRWYQQKGITLTEDYQAKYESLLRTVN